MTPADLSRGRFALAPRRQRMIHVDYDATGLHGTNGTLLQFSEPVSELYLNAELMRVLKRLYDLRPDKRHSEVDDPSQPKDPA